MVSNDNNLQGVIKETLSPLLKYAALGNVVDAIKNRIAKGDSIDGQDRDGFTSLMYASKKGNLEAVETLISLNANLDLKNNKNQTAEDIAREFGFQEIINFLEGARQTIKPPDDFFDLSSWIEDTEPNLPIHNYEVDLEINKTHQKITKHRVINRDEDWDDIDLYLPIFRKRKEKLSPTDKSLLRKIIYHGYKAGYIPISCLEQVALDEHLVIDEVLLDALVTLFEDFEFKIEPFFKQIELDEPDYEDSYLEDIYGQLLYLLESSSFDESWFYKSLNGSLSNSELLTHEDEIALGKTIEESYLSCIKSISTNLAALKVISEDFNLICSGLIERHEIISEQVDLDGDLDGNDQLDMFVEPVYDPAAEEGALLQSNSDLLEFISIVDSYDALSSDRVFTFLLNINISFKYLQSLVFENRVTDSSLLGHIELAFKARNKLVTSNLRLANHIARAYRYSDMPITDLVQEGFTGLIKAAEKFEYKKGFRFTTYATWWIRQSVSRFVQDKSREIRLPVHLGDLINKVERIDKTLNEIPPSQRILIIAQNLGITERRVKSAKNSMFTMISIDSDYDSDIELLESYDFPNDRDREDPIPNWMLRRSFETLFKKLEPKDVTIIKNRFGWYDGQAMTLEEVGELYGVTRERIRQIEAKVLRKLSTPGSLRHLGTLSKKDL